MADSLPLFPLGSVLFPGVVLPLHVFQPRYRELVRHLMDRPAEQVREFGVVAIRRGTETGELDASCLYPVGCSAELRQITSHPDGRYDIVSVGRRRFRLRSVVERDTPYLRAEVDWLPDRSGPDGDAARLAPNVLAAFRGYLRLLAEATSSDGGPPADAEGEQLPEDPAVLANLVAASASLTVADRQRLLAAPDTATRLKAELVILRRETGLIATLPAVPVPLVDFQVPFSPN